MGGLERGGRQADERPAEGVEKSGDAKKQTYGNVILAAVSATGHWDVRRIYKYMCKELQ